MAITSVGTLGTGISSTSSSNFTFTTTSQIEANNEAILVVVTDNIVTTDTNSNTHTSVTIGAANMIKLGEYTNGNGSAGTGVTTSIWRYRPSSSVGSGTTVTMNLSGSVTDKTSSMWEFTSTNPLMLDATPASNPIYNVNDVATSWGSVSFSGLSSTLRLYFRGLGREANTTTALTTSSNFTTITPQRSRNNASAVMVRGEFRINTSTGETSNPSVGTSGDNAAVFVALVERVTTTKTLTGKANIVAPLVADGITDKRAALSLRKIVAGYTGYCGRVQRASDSTTLDVGFIGNELDVSAIHSFCAGTTGRWVRWYFQDKDDGSYVAPAGTGAIIYENYAVIRYLNNPALKFLIADGVKYEFPTGMLNGATALTYIHVGKLTNPLGSNRGVFAPSTSNSTGLEVLQAKVISVDTQLRINGTQRVGGNGTNLLFGDDVLSVTEIYGSASSMSVYYNGSSVTMTDSSAMPALNFNGVYALGGYAGSYYSEGLYQELIIAETDNSSNRTTPYNNIRNYWNTLTSPKILTGRARISNTLSPATATRSVNVNVEETSTINNAIWTATPDGSFSNGSTSYKKNYQSSTAGTKTVKARANIWTNGANSWANTINSDETITTVLTNNWDYILSSIYIQDIGDYVEWPVQRANASGFYLAGNLDSYYTQGYTTVLRVARAGYTNEDTPITGGTAPGDILKLEIITGRFIRLYKNGVEIATSAIPIPENCTLTVGWANSAAGQGWVAGDVLPKPNIVGTGVGGQGSESSSESATITVNATTTRTNTGLGRIQKSVSQTLTGKARIQRTSPLTINGLSRLQKVNSPTINGLTRIQKVNSPTITGVARIEKTSGNTLSGKANIESAEIEEKEGILKTHANAVMGFALRSLDQDYTDSCLRVRRSTDNTEQDIGFDEEGILDWASATAFASGGDLFVRTWYDQTASGWDIEQTTNSYQPKLNLSTHRIDFNNSYLTRSSIAIGARRTYSIFQKARFDTVSGTQVLFEFAAVSFVLTAISGGSLLSQDYDNASTNTKYGTVSVDTNYVFSTILNRNASTVEDTNKFYANGVELTSDFSLGNHNGVDYSSPTNLFIGAYDASLTYPLDGSIEELIVFTDAKNDTDRQAIEEDIEEGLGAFSASPFDEARVITIHKESIEGSLSNFPVSIIGEYSFLATVANGGKVSNDNGYDISFFADPSLTTQLPHQLVNYNPTTGFIEANVKISSLSSSDDTVIYIAYGNPSITTSQNNNTVWDSNYVAVYHLGDGTTVSASDSTSNAFNGTISGTVVASDGVLGGGATFDGSNYIDMPTGVSTALNGTEEITSSVWFKGSDIKHIISIYGNGWWIMAFGGYQTIHYWDGYNNYGAPVVYEDNPTIPNVNDGEWHLVTNTWKRNTVNGFRTYIDGELVFQRTSADVALDVGGSGINRIGYFMYDGTIGRADEARISKVARSADWIKTEYNNQSNTVEFYSIEGVTTKFISGKSAIQNTSNNTLSGISSIVGLIDPDNPTAAINTNVELTSTTEASVWESTPDGSFSAGSTAFKRNFQAPTSGIKNIYVRGSAWDLRYPYPANAATQNSDGTLTVANLVTYSYSYFGTLLAVSLSEPGDWIEHIVSENGFVSPDLYSDIDNEYTYFGFYPDSGQLYIYAYNNTDSDELYVPYFEEGDVVRVKIESDWHIGLYLNGVQIFETSFAFPEIQFRPYGYGYMFDIGDTVPSFTFGGTGIEYLGPKSYGTVTVGTPATTQTLYGKGRLQKTSSPIIAGLGRIQKVISQTLSGKGDVRNTTSQTINAVAKITSSITQTLDAKARLQKTVTLTTTGISRLRKTVSTTTTGLARVNKSITLTLNGVTRITNLQPRTITGVGRLTVSTVKTVNAISRVQKGTTVNITGLAKVGNSIGVVITGKADITNYTLRTTTGLARLRKTVTTTINAFGRIQKVLTVTTTGLGRIQKPVLNTIIGKSYLKLIGVRTLLGKAKIDADLAYSKDALTSLPTTNNNLVNIYNSTQVDNTEAQDDVLVTLKGSGYLIHQFKVRTEDLAKAIRISWKGYSTVSTADRPVILQVFNINSSVWETIGNNQNTTAGQLITVNGTKGGTNIADYYDAESYCYLRVYQFVGGNGAYFG